MAKHVNWDVRNGRDGATYITRTQVDRSMKPDGTRVTVVKTDHTKIRIPKGRS
jgi:hypothetical protein